MSRLYNELLEAFEEIGKLENNDELVEMAQYYKQENNDGFSKNIMEHLDIDDVNEDNHETIYEALHKADLNEGAFDDDTSSSAEAGFDEILDRFSNEIAGFEDTDSGDLNVVCETESGAEKVAQAFNDYYGDDNACTINGSEVLVHPNVDINEDAYSPFEDLKGEDPLTIITKIVDYSRENPSLDAKSMLADEMRNGVLANVDHFDLGNGYTIDKNGNGFDSFKNGNHTSTGNLSAAADEIVSHFTGDDSLVEDKFGDFANDIYDAAKDVFTVEVEGKPVLKLGKKEIAQIEKIATSTKDKEEAYDKALEFVWSRLDQEDIDYLSNNVDDRKVIDSFSGPIDKIVDKARRKDKFGKFKDKVTDLLFEPAEDEPLNEADKNGSEATLEEVKEAVKETIHELASKKYISISEKGNTFTLKPTQAVKHICIDGEAWKEFVDNPITISVDEFDDDNDHVVEVTVNYGDDIDSIYFNYSNGDNEKSYDRISDSLSNLITDEAIEYNVREANGGEDLLDDSLNEGRGVIDAPGTVGGRPAGLPSDDPDPDAYGRAMDAARKEIRAKAGETYTIVGQQDLGYTKRNRYAGVNLGSRKNGEACVLTMGEHRTYELRTYFSDLDSAKQFLAKFKEKFGGKNIEFAVKKVSGNNPIDGHTLVKADSDCGSYYHAENSSLYEDESLTETIDNDVEVTFECEDCGYTFSQTYGKDYFEDEDDLNLLMNESDIDCPECGGHARAVEVNDAIYNETNRDAALDESSDELDDIDLATVKPIKVGKWETSLPVGAAKKVWKVISDLPEDEFEIVNDNAWDALDGNKDALKVVYGIFKKHGIPTKKWILSSFVNNWDED